MPWLPSESQRVLQMTRSAHCTMTMEPQKAPCEKWSASFCIMRLATFEYIWGLVAVVTSFAMNGYAKVGGTVELDVNVSFVSAVFLVNFVLAPSVPSRLAEQSVVREDWSEPKICLPMRMPVCVTSELKVERDAPVRSAASVEANWKLVASMLVTPVVLQSVAPVKYDVPTRAPWNFSCTSPIVDSITEPSVSLVLSIQPAVRVVQAVGSAAVTVAS